MCCLVRPITHLMGRSQMSMEQWWNHTGRENRKTRRKTCPSTTLSTKTHTRIDPDANPGLRGERPLEPWHGLCCVTISLYCIRAYIAKDAHAPRPNQQTHNQKIYIIWISSVSNTTNFLQGPSRQSVRWCWAPRPAASGYMNGSKLTPRAVDPSDSLCKRRKNCSLDLHFPRVLKQ
jgi:hypothetical protein